MIMSEYPVTRPRFHLYTVLPRRIKAKRSFWRPPKQAEARTVRDQFVLLCNLKITLFRTFEFTIDNGVVCYTIKICHLDLTLVKIWTIARYT